MSIESVHKDKEYWGDPYVFRPERFLDAEGNLIPGSSDRVLTFGLGKTPKIGNRLTILYLFLFRRFFNLASALVSGRRRCLGELIARQCIFMFFTSIIRKFHVTVLPGSKPPSEVPLPGITLSPQKYKVHISPRISAS